MSSDRIEKQVVLHASRDRVWKALTDSGEFGTWFGMQFKEPFAPGVTVHGVIVGTKVDPAVAKMQEPMFGAPVVIMIDRVDPKRLFSFRWHPHTVDFKGDVSKEPTTLVEFELEDAAGGILLKVTESGFDGVPEPRREAAFDGNSQGWALQMTLVEKYLARGT